MTVTAGVMERRGGGMEGAREWRREERSGQGNGGGARRGAGGGMEGARGEEQAGGLKGTRGEEGAGEWRGCEERRGGGAWRGREERRGRGPGDKRPGGNTDGKRHRLSGTRCVPDRMYDMCYLTFFQLC